jgi:hypothetical protein
VDNDKGHKILVFSVFSMGDEFAHFPLESINMETIHKNWRMASAEYEVVVVTNRTHAKFIKNDFNSQKLPMIFLDNLGNFLKSQIYRL